MEKMNYKNDNMINEIKDIPGELRIKPLHYYRCKRVLNMPKTLKTVQELRDEIETHPENLLLLNEVLRDVQLISKKSELLKEKTIRELYEEAYNSINMASMNIYIEIYKETIKKNKLNF